MNLSPTELCAILEACGKAQVASLKWGDLQVEFGPKASLPALAPSPSWGSGSLTNLTQATSPTSATEMAALQREIAAKSLLMDEEALREDQISLLAIENPTELERMVQQGELDRDADVGDDEDT